MSTGEWYGLLAAIFIAQIVAKPIAVAIAFIFFALSIVYQIGAL